MYNECHLLTNTEYLQGQIVPITALLKWLYNLTWYCLDNYLNLVQLFPFFSLSCSCRYVECFRRAPLTTADLRIAIHSELLWETIRWNNGNSGTHKKGLQAWMGWAEKLYWERSKRSYWALLMHCSVCGKQAPAGHTGKSAMLSRDRGMLPEKKK